MNKQDITIKIQKILADHGKTLFLKGRADNQPMICGKGCPDKILKILETLSTQVRKEERERIIKSLWGLMVSEATKEEEKHNATIRQLLASLTPQVKEECTCIKSYTNEDVFIKDSNCPKHCRPEEKLTEKQFVKLAKKVRKDLPKGEL